MRSAGSTASPLRPMRRKRVPTPRRCRPPPSQVLAREIDARAEKLGAAGDEQFVLTSDGTVRWTGDAVAKLVAADDALHPRLRIIADERLTGAPRRRSQTRLDLWLKTHIEKLLGPLFDLSKAEDVTGIARGIAFQLVEALGVIERSKIAAEMKDLDQPSRATLRKYGVRFGAYHIYFPTPAQARRARARRAAVGDEAGQCRSRRRCRARSIWPAAAARLSRSTRPCRAMPIACSAIASAASARCASIFWSGSPT